MYFRVHISKIVPRKIFCASPSDGQMATLSDTLMSAGREVVDWRSALIRADISHMVWYGMVRYGILEYGMERGLQISIY